jgi:hypothetical protein
VFLHDRERGYRTITVREAAVAGPIEASRASLRILAGCGKALWARENFDGSRMCLRQTQSSGTTVEVSREMLKMAVQRGRSE